MIRDWLQLARVSNAPTVVSNVLSGVAVGLASGPLLAPPSPVVSVGLFDPLPMLALASLAAVALYSGGMILNDVCDTTADRRERPDRPIPAGRVSRRAALPVSLLLILLGGALLPVAPALTGLVADVHPPALWLSSGLVVCVVLYNLLHRTGAWAVLLMAGCRSLLVLVAAAAIAWPLDPFIAPTVAASLGVYVAVLSLGARRESDRPGRPARVMQLIAAISLLDALFLVVLGRWTLAGAALACYGITRLMHRRIMGS